MSEVICGYCDLCRAKELELYGKILNRAGPKHSEACRQAGCKHPAAYSFEEVDAMDLMAEEDDRMMFLMDELSTPGKKKKGSA